MLSLINVMLAGNILIVIFSLLFLFHIFVLIGIVPRNIVWAGKIKTKKELIIMESISLFISLLAFFIVGLKIKHLNFIEYSAMIDIGIWFLLGLFIFNTLGNLNAKNRIEKYGFGTLTFIISLLILRIVIG